jgi:hypothetical protein
MYKIIFRDGLRSEIQIAYQWYENQRQGLGDEFLFEIEKAFLLLKNNPHYYSFIYKTRRRLLIKKFPYKIIFEIFNYEVVIFALKHSRQKPEF